MNIILLSGGSGKRLWPLSNDIRSKQFIKIFKTETGEYQSMVQRVYGQLKTAMPEAAVTIATSKSQVSSILSQLGEQVGLSVEPARRDTFPAIALAAAYLADVQGVDLAEPVVVCPVDPLVEIEYFHALARLGEQAAKGEANLVLMGIEPTYPSEKYGYIIPEGKEELSGAASFKEKPDAQTASEYISQGALWNGGVFAFRLGYLLAKAHTLIDFTDYQDLLANYENVKKISFDYAVVEQEASIQVMRFNGQWKDLGTWNTLTEAMDEQSVGKTILNDTCTNVHVVNELDVPVLAMGLKNVVISASPEGILVSDKEQSAYIKPYVDDIQQQVMFAEKSWGSYQVLNVETDSLTVLVTLNPGHSMNYHSHQYRNEVWTVISGHGHAVIDDKVQNVRTGDVLTMQAGCKHTIFADIELKLIEVQLGPNISVTDKQKHEYLLNTKCFGGADIRGLYPEQVNEEMAYRIGRHFSEILRAQDRAAVTPGGKEEVEPARLRVAVGHDVRLSGESLQKALVHGLLDSGCQAVDIGQCGTEMIYFATAHLKLDGGIMITASHNPKGYNGFKLVGADAKPVSRDSGLRQLEQLCAGEGGSLPHAHTGIGKGRSAQVVRYDILPEYIEHLLSYVDLSAVRQAVSRRRKPFRVAVNAGNGGAGRIIDELEKRLPFDFIKVNNEPDGNFPNGVPNPILNENREATAKVVRQTGADAGIAWDGDFDRCFMFDEAGCMIEGYYMVGFLAEAFLQKNAGAKIIHDTRVYWNTQDICLANGGEAVLQRSGHSFIKEKMRQTDAVYGGEMSSHHYFKDFSYCDSGMIPWLLVLEQVVQNGQPLSKLLQARMDMYPCSGEINTRVDSMAEAEMLLSRAEAHYADAAIDHVDGLSAAYEDWRFNLRKSNTEPVIRLNVETRGNKALLKEKTCELLDLLRSHSQ